MNFPGNNQTIRIWDSMDEPTRTQINSGHTWEIDATTFPLKIYVEGIGQGRTELQLTLEGHDDQQRPLTDIFVISVVG